jgi:hypothetical protein
MSHSLEILRTLKILFFDSTNTGDGQASSLAQRMSSAIKRQGVDLSGPFSAVSPEVMADLLRRHADANCVFLLAGAPEDLSSIPRLLSSTGVTRDDDASRPKLIAVYTSQSPQVPDTARAVGQHAPATIVVNSKRDMSPREAIRFFAKFFGELHTHCPDGISVPMVRFCFAKASRLAPGKAEVWM